MKFAAGAAAMLFFAASPALAQSTNDRMDPAQNDAFGLTFTTGVDYSSGDYGLADETEILVVPFSLRAASDAWAFTASIPYISINGPGVILGPDGQPIPGVPTASGERSGIGDLSLGASYTLRPNPAGGLELTLGGRVKLPTADQDKQLSTGETDFTVSAEAAYAFGNVIPFASVGYRFLGDPDGFDLRNGATASVGSSFVLGTNVLIASYDYTRASSRLAEDSHELFAGLSVPATNRLTFTGYGIAGLSEGSPDYGLGLLLSAKFR